MPFNGTGTFVREHNWQDDADNSIDIEPDRMDEEDDGFATGLSGCITRNGQSPATADLPMATFKHTNVGNGAARNQYAALGQMQDGLLNWADAGGTADALTAAYSPAVTALSDGQICCVRAAAPNATTTPTFAPNAITAHTMTKIGGVALAIGDIAGAGHELILRYKLADTRWELLNPAIPAIPFVFASASGPASLAFAEDTDNGSNKVTLKAPASVTADVDVILPGVASTLATLTGTETLDNKSLTDSTTTIVDNGDATKKLAFQCSNIATGTTRTLTVPDANGTIALTSGVVFSQAYTSTDQTITSAGSLTLAHGLGVAPKNIEYQLVCQSSENGYTTGDVVPIGKIATVPGGTGGAASQYHTAVIDSTNINLRFGSATAVYQLPNFSTGNIAALTNTNWKLRVKAWA